MGVRFVACMVLLAAAAFGAAGDPPRPPGFPARLPWPQVSKLSFQRGDDPRWAARDFDDSAWPKISDRSLPSRDGIYWVRFRVQAGSVEIDAVRDGLLLKVVASYDVYWDGRLIARNGRVAGSAADEVPGYVDALYQIPAELLGAGEHVVALRMSSFHTGFSTATYALISEWGNFRRMLVERLRTAIFSVMAVGAALVVAVVFGLMWLLAGRRFAVLIFSVLFLCVAVLQALQAWRWLYEYPYSWHYPRLLVITALTTAMAALLPAFVVQHFNLPGRRWKFAALAVLLTAAWFVNPIYNAISLVACSIGFVTALVLSIHAAVRGRRGAGFACGGLAISVVALVLAPRDFLDHAFFISAGPAVVGLLIALVLQLRDERREARQAVLTAARLEVELLKKNIQPHFLLNTLATIQEVIEQEPKTAIALIDALANEFRILARVSGERLIPLAQEIALCQAHLDVMSLRRGVRCALLVRGGQESDLVPPALFHTLIENGLSHLLPASGRQDFELQIEHRGDTTRYALLARGRRQIVPARSAADTAGPPVAGKEGTGLRYIRARLQESFTDRWSMASGPVPEGWETIIEITAMRSAAAENKSVRASVPIQREEPA